MEELALNMLDIVENSVTAGANCVQVRFEEYRKSNTLLIAVKDDGPGMDQELVEKVLDPFVTSRTTRDVGMGLPLLRQLSEDCEGEFLLESEPGKGTLIEAIFRLDHLDRPPIGDVATTFMTLIIGYPHIQFELQAISDSLSFHLDTCTLTSILESHRPDSPEGLRRLREHIERGIKETCFIDHVASLAETQCQPCADKVWRS